jgi:hypothetical protein
MLEDWLGHPDPVDGYREKIVMEMLIEEYSKELIKSFSQGAEQMMMTTMPRHATIDERKF